MTPLSLILFTIYGGNLFLGASLDCNNANTFREQTICNDPQLSKLDREIGVTFERLNKKGEYYKEIDKKILKSEPLLPERIQIED